MILDFAHCGRSHKRQLAEGNEPDCFCCCVERLFCGTLIFLQDKTKPRKEVASMLEVMVEIVPNIAILEPKISLTATSVLSLFEEDAPPMKEIRSIQFKFMAVLNAINPNVSALEMME